MKHWRQDKLDKLAKREKVRRSKSRKQEVTHELLASEFEVPESDWVFDDGDEELFAARVVEVHKRYAFVSVESKKGKIDTNDVWLATIARRFTQAQRKERNFITVGDRVLCRPGSQAGSEVSEDLPSAIKNI